MHGFYEFFAGGGMARAGLGDRWECLFANDFDPKKAETYIRNWGKTAYRFGDVAELITDELPGHAELAWASFPCQDLSLAGSRAGLQGKRSGTFWPFWHLIEQLKEQQRAPRIVVLENVYGALRSHGGRDFQAIAEALTRTGYRFGALIIDAIHFLPQSRPRLFIVSVSEEVLLPEQIVRSDPDLAWHPSALVDAKEKLLTPEARKWIWWNPGSLPLRTLDFSDIIEDPPIGVQWHTPDVTARLLSMMSPTNRAKVTMASASGKQMIGGVYKRTRQGQQRAEVRFDVAGCLRTPTGGSSRQTILAVQGHHLRSRLLSPREAARLMGLPDTYQLPDNYNDAYHLAGDGLAVPVVRFLADRILEPLLHFSDHRLNKDAA